MIIKNTTYKVILLVFLLLVIGKPVKCQISEGGIPLTLQEDFLSKRKLKTVKQKGIIQLPYVDNEKEMEIAGSKNNAAHYGKALELEINIKDTAAFFQLDDGKLWLLKIISPTAYGMQFHFNRYSLPVGAKLFIYNKEETMILGAFTSKNNNEHNTFVTQDIKGKEIFIEYFEPSNTGEGELKIDKIGHVYRNLYDGNSGGGECYKDAACYSKWEKERRAVCKIQYLAVAGKDAGSLMTATGVLVNNTNYDAEPYLLTATHCYEKNNTIISNLNEWIFKFNYENEECNGDALLSTNSVTGCNNIIYSPGLDIMLVRLWANKDNLVDFGVTYAGWTSWDYSAGSVTDNSHCISHPEGLPKKYAKDKDKVQQEGNFYNVQFDEGTAFGGSSGGPLFNDEYEIIGLCSQAKDDPPPENACDDPGHAILFSNLSLMFQYNEVFKNTLAPNAHAEWPETNTLVPVAPGQQLDVTVEAVEVNGSALDDGSLTVWADVGTTDIKFRATVNNGTPPYTFSWSVYNETPDDMGDGTPWQTIGNPGNNTHTTGNISFEEPGNYFINLHVQDGMGYVSEKDYSFTLSEGSPCVVARIENTDCATRYEFAKGTYIKFASNSFSYNHDYNEPGCDPCFCKYNCNYDPGRLEWYLDGDIVDVSEYLYVYGYLLDKQNGEYIAHDVTGCFHLDIEEGKHTIKLKAYCGVDDNNSTIIKEDEYSLITKNIYVVDCDKTEKIENNTDLEDVLENNEYKTGKIQLYPEAGEEITVESGETVKLEGRKYVHIKKGFHAKKGSNFSTKIDPCPETDCECPPWDMENKKSLKNLNRVINEDTINSTNRTIVNIYPNPTKNGQFYVNFDHDHEMPYNIEIYNSMGHLVYSKNDIYNTTAKYDISGQAKGLFLVSIKYNNKRKILKIIKN